MLLAVDASCTDGTEQIKSRRLYARGETDQEKILQELGHHVGQHHFARVMRGDHASGARVENDFYRIRLFYILIRLGLSALRLNFIQTRCYKHLPAIYVCSHCLTDLPRQGKPAAQLKDLFAAQ